MHTHRHARVIHILRRAQLVGTHRQHALKGALQMEDATAVLRVERRHVLVLGLWRWANTNERVSGWVREEWQISQ